MLKRALGDRLDQGVEGVGRQILYPDPGRRTSRCKELGVGMSGS